MCAINQLAPNCDCLPKVALPLGESLGVPECFRDQLGVVMARPSVELLHVKVDGAVGIVGVVPATGKIHQHKQIFGIICTMLHELKKFKLNLHK